MPEWFWVPFVAIGEALLLARWAMRADPSRWLRRIVVTSFALRAGLGTALFLISYWHLPVLTGFQYPDQPGFWTFSPDAFFSHYVGTWVNQNWINHEPVFDPGMTIDHFILVACIYRLLGICPLYPILLNCGLAAATGVLAYRIGQRLFDGPAARWAAGLVSFWPSSILWSTQLLKDPVCWFLVFLTMALFLSFVQPPPSGSAPAKPRVATLIGLAAALFLVSRLRLYLGIALMLSISITVLAGLHRVFRQRGRRGLVEWLGIALASWLVIGASKAFNLRQMFLAYHAWRYPAPVAASGPEPAPEIALEPVAAPESPPVTVSEAEPVAAPESPPVTVSEAEPAPVSVASIPELPAAPGPVVPQDTALRQVAKAAASTGARRPAQQSARAPTPSPEASVLVPAVVPTLVVEFQPTPASTEAPALPEAGESRVGEPDVSPEPVVSALLPGVTLNNFSEIVLQAAPEAPALSEAGESRVGEPDVSPEPVVSAPLPGVTLNDISEIVLQASPLTLGFRLDGFMSSGGTLVDPHVKFRQFNEMLPYLPRAVMVGLFAPFPSQWTPGGSTGFLRVLSSVEMLAFYLIFALGFLPAVWDLVAKRRLEGTCVLAFIAIMLAALGLVVSNLGILYRVRLPVILAVLVLSAGKIPATAGWLTARLDGRRRKFFGYAIRSVDDRCA